MPYNTVMYVGISYKDIAVFLAIHNNEQIRNIGYMTNTEAVISPKLLAQLCWCYALRVPFI
jgi:hypothetical protein